MAHEDKTALEIRGGGSKAFYGGQPRGELLDMTALTGISSHEPTELVVTVRAGTLLSELEAALAVHGQCLAFEPPRFGELGTVGGMAAAGLAGPARISAGGLRDHLLGATLLNGRGELLSFGGQVMKNVAGYDISRLLAGSMGVLGVICELSLKVLPMPVATSTLEFDFDQAQALAWFNAHRAKPLPLTASSCLQAALAAGRGHGCRQLGREGTWRTPCRCSSCRCLVAGLARPATGFLRSRCSSHCGGRMPLAALNAGRRAAAGIAGRLST